MESIRFMLKRRRGRRGHNTLAILLFSPRPPPITLSLSIRALAVEYFANSVFNKWL